MGVVEDFFRRMNQTLTMSNEPWTRDFAVKALSFVLMVVALLFILLNLALSGWASFRIGVLLFLVGTSGLAYFLAHYDRARLANVVLISGFCLSLTLGAAVGQGVVDFAYYALVAAVLYTSYAYEIRAGIGLALVCGGVGLWMLLARQGDEPIVMGYADQMRMWSSNTLFFVASAIAFGFLVGSINRFHKLAVGIRRQLERVNLDLAYEIRQRRRAEVYLRSLVSHLPALLFRINQNGVIVFADGRGLQILHIHPDRLVGKTLAEVFGAAIDMGQQGETLTRGQGLRVQLNGMYWDGYFTPVMVEESEAEQVALFINTTEQAMLMAKTSEYATELERSNAELEQFAYVASHDLKEPIRSVSGFLNLALRQGQGELDPVVMDCIVQARDATGRMQTLVTDLLAYARVGRQRREPREVDANDLMLLVVRDLRGALEACGARVTWDDLPMLVTDPTQLLQVLENLVSNGIKFQADRVPKVHVSSRRIAGGWRFEVRDNGIGIAPENQRRIFQIFQRLHTREEYAGTGIGLALCRRIVESWGGRLGVESVVGEGSTFWFTVPTDDTSPTQPVREGSMKT